MMKKYKVYVVDDDRTVLDTLDKQLKKTYEVTCFVAPERCLSKALDEQCDLLIADINMPQMDGIALLSEFRKYYPLTPVLILTGFGSVSIAKKAISMGANDFLEKPFDRTQFLDTIKQLLSEYAILCQFAEKYTLTKMQFVILQHIIAGRGTKEMAYLMNRSVRTLESHRYKMMKKVGASNVNELLTNPYLLGYFESKFISKDRIGEIAPST